MLKKLLILILSINRCFGVIQNIRVFRQGTKQVVLISNATYVCIYRRSETESVLEKGREGKVLPDREDKELLLQALELLGKSGQAGILIYEGNEDAIVYPKKLIKDGKKPYIPLRVVCSFLASEKSKIGNIILRSGDLRTGSTNHFNDYVADLDNETEEFERMIFKKICSESLEEYLTRLRCKNNLEIIKQKIAKFQLSEKVLAKVADLFKELEENIDNFESLFKDIYKINLKKPYVDALFNLYNNVENGQKAVDQSRRILPCLDFVKLSLIAHCLEAITETDSVIVVADYYNTDYIAQLLLDSGFEQEEAFGETDIEKIYDKKYKFDPKDLKIALGTLINIKCSNAQCQGVMPADMQCARCKKVFYCSRDCQKADWEKHKKTCKKAE